MTFQLPDLPYDFSALVPHIDAMTMKLHYSKHHQSYVTNLNKALADMPLPATSLESLLKNVRQHGDAVRNHGGGHYNHTLFWTILSPERTQPSSVLTDAIQERFGSSERFREEFTTAAAGKFGAGWAWLYVDAHAQLNICTTSNQDNPLMDVVPSAHRGVPILGLDVWEHAYYLQYQNRRSDYITAFWEIVNWQEVEQRWQAAR